MDEWTALFFFHQQCSQHPTLSAEDEACDRIHMCTVSLHTWPHCDGCT